MKRPQVLMSTLQPLEMKQPRLKLKRVLISHGLRFFPQKYLCALHTCICIHLHNIIYVYIYIHVHVRVYMYINMYVCVYVCMYVCMYMYECICVSVCVYVWICMYVSTFVGSTSLSTGPMSSHNVCQSSSSL